MRDKIELNGGNFLLSGSIHAKKVAQQATSGQSTLLNSFIILRDICFHFHRFIAYLYNFGPYGVYMIFKRYVNFPRVLIGQF